MIQESLLKKIDILKEVNEDILNEIQKGCQLKTLNKGEILFEYKSRISSLYMILDGRVELILPIKDKTELKIYEAKAGDTIGLSSLLDDSCHTIYTARCSKAPTQVIELKAEILKEIFNKDIGFAYTFSKILLKEFNTQKVRQNIIFLNTILDHPALKKVVKGPYTLNNLAV